MGNIRAIIFDFGRTIYDRDSNRIFSEVPEVLEKLSLKYKTAVVSMAPKGDFEERRKILRDNNLENYFSSIVFVKEDKDSAYEKVISELQVNPEEVVIVDDRVKRGISWGNRRGTTTIWLRNGKFRDELPDENTGEPTHTITSLPELLQILQ